MRVYTLSEIESHNCKEDCWLIIDDKVYDVTDFIKLHPGGVQTLVQNGGKDATSLFYSLHRSEILKKYNKYCIGSVANVPPPTTKLISDIPFSELMHWQGFHSPYFTSHHKDFQKKLRIWLQDNVQEIAEAHERSGKRPKKAMHRLFGQAGLRAITSGCIKFIPKAQCLGFPGKELDHFHEQIVIQEYSRMDAYGFLDGCSSAGSNIGLPPVLLNGKRHHIEEIVRPVLLGENNICLAISEPYAGSDVAGLQTTAVKSECGQFYIVNGIKKWITCAMQSDWFTTAVRTGGPGAKGISVLCIPRVEGVKTRPIDIATYSHSSGTALIEFDNVKVPAKYLIGKENQGFKVIMSNFNHERWILAAGGVSMGHRCVQECLRWAKLRKAFGKSLSDQPVIRYKLGMMICRVQASQAYLDQITYQMDKMSVVEQFKYLGPSSAFLKVQVTDMIEAVTSDACQVFGGRSITRSGMGKAIQRARAVVKGVSITGGSMEVMADLGARMVFKKIKSHDAKL